MSFENSEELDNYENLQPERVCRLCLREETNMKPLIETKWSSIVEDIPSLTLEVQRTKTRFIFISLSNDFLYVQIPENDNFPKNLCIKCNCEIDRWKEFKNKVIRSETILRHVLHKLELKLSKINDNSSYSDSEVFIEDANSVKNETFSNTTKSSAYKTKSCASRTFECDICKKQVKTMHSLKRHARIHSGEKPHVCDICKKAFAEPGNLTKHLRKHSKDKKHQCNECGLRFYERNKLTIHVRTHTGEKPFACKVCARAFATSSQVQIHMKVGNCRLGVFISYFSAHNL